MDDAYAMRGIHVSLGELIEILCRFLDVARWAIRLIRILAARKQDRRTLPWTELLPFESITKQ
jgi:hypothetical protein